MLKMTMRMALAAGAGFCLVIQQVLNTGLRAALGSAVWSGFTSYVVGTICMGLLASVLREPFPSIALISRLPL